MKSESTSSDKLTQTTEGLSRRVILGGFWVFALRLTNRLLGLVSTMILARILAPADFGLFGIALMAMAALDTFSQTGLNASLVQKKKDIIPYLDTAWTVQALRGSLIALILFLSAPYVAAFFDTPAATPILQVIGLANLIQGFTNIGIIYFHRELEFHKQYVYRLSGTVAHVGVAIAAVLLLKNVWALVFGHLAGRLVEVAVSYIIHPYRPRFRLNLEQFKELFAFGKWVLGSSILIYLVIQGDNILVGKLLGVTALGFYQMAYNISNMPATEVTHVISQVTFPAYAKLQADIPKLKEAYFKVLQFTAFFSFPVAGLIFVLAADFTRIFLGEKWLPMVPAMQILVFAGLLRSIAATAGPVFVATGNPRLDTQGQFLRLLTIAILIYPLAKVYGVEGVSLAVVASILATTIMFIYQVIKLTRGGITEFIKIMLFPLISIFPMITINLFYTNSLILGISGFIVFSLGYFLSYLLLMYFFDRLSNNGMMLLLKQKLPLVRG